MDQKKIQKLKLIEILLIYEKSHQITLKRKEEVININHLFYPGIQSTVSRRIWGLTLRRMAEEEEEREEVFVEEKVKCLD